MNNMSAICKHGVTAADSCDMVAKEKSKRRHSSDGVEVAPLVVIIDAIISIINDKKYC